MGASQFSKLSFTVLILASGRGERFIASGGKTHKLDALIHEKTVLQATLDKASASGLHCHVERKNHLGMGDSIAAAVAANQDADGWLILPADMPLIPTEIILAVADGLKEAEVCVPIFKGQRGHPVGFSRSCLRNLLTLSGDKGARALFSQFLVKQIDVDDVPYAAGCVVDIDTLDDLEMAKKNGIFG